MCAAYMYMRVRNVFAQAGEQNETSETRETTNKDILTDTHLLADANRIRYCSFSEWESTSHSQTA